MADEKKDEITGGNTDPKLTSPLLTPRMQNDSGTQTERKEESSHVRREDLSLRDMFNRFLEEDFFGEPFDFTRNTRLASLFNRHYLPRIDVSQTPTHVKVVADVPGIDPDDIDIDIQGEKMYISGSSERVINQDERPYRYERTYGEFRREFMLPCPVNKDEIKAVYKDGVLSITLPKQEGSKKDKVRIERE
jgi:HSP20 family protein